MKFDSQDPFPHKIIDNFFPTDIAKQLEVEFPLYDYSDWYVYNNALEEKKALNNWHKFPSLTYQILSLLNSQAFTIPFSEMCGHHLYPDCGLNGGGWHIHADGGNLNPHLDQQMHPKLMMQRKLNLIIYLSSNFKEEYGGHLGFWKDNKLVKTIYPAFNRGVIFDVSGESWHGLATSVSCPEGVYRKSLAVYYFCHNTTDTGIRKKALFAQREGQSGLEGLIKRRAEGEYI